MELEVHWAGPDPKCVGKLYQNDRGIVFFEYDPLWRTGSRELSPIYLLNSTQGAVSTPTPGFGELHGLFQDIVVPLGAVCPFGKGSSAFKRNLG